MTTVVYRRDRQALSTARFCRAGQLATANTSYLPAVGSAGGPRANIAATLQSVGATEMLRTLNVTGLLQLTATDNHTVFAPTNDALAAFTPRSVYALHLPAHYSAPNSIGTTTLWAVTVPRCGWGAHAPQIVARPPDLAVLLTHSGQLILRKISKFDATDVRF